MHSANVLTSGAVFAAAARDLQCVTNAWNGVLPRSCLLLHSCIHTTAANTHTNFARQCRRPDNTTASGAPPARNTYNPARVQGLPSAGERPERQAHHAAPRKSRWAHSVSPKACRCAL